MSRLSFRARRLPGLLAAVLVAGALVAPIVLSSQGGSAPPCASRLTFRAHGYARRSPPAGTTQGEAIGVGMLTGCGRAPENVNVRSLVGQRPAHAIAIDGDNGIYVRRR